MSEYDLTKPKEQPKLDVKHLIWILDWAREHCADQIERLELESVRHSAWSQTLHRSQHGTKERTARRIEIDKRLNEYAGIYDWLEGAMTQARDVSNEEFGRQMAEMFGKKGKK